MSYYLVKIAITTALVVAISEIAKRNSLAAAILASVPLISVMALFWLYVETGNVDKVSDLARAVFWLVLPSLVLFLVLQLLLKQGLNFYLSMLISLALTGVCYWITIVALQHFGGRP